MIRMRVAGATGIAVGVLLALTGCFGTLPPAGGPTSAPPAQSDPPVSGEGAPVGWDTLPTCPDGPADWIWIDGFPADQLAAAGLEAECGATYLDTESPAYTSVSVSSVSLEKLEALAGALEAVGYELTASTFDPVEVGDPSGLAGTWEYSRDADDPDARTVIYIVNFSTATEPILYYTYVDFESPGTRALAD